MLAKLSLKRKKKGQSAFCGQWTTMAMHRRSLIAIFDDRLGTSAEKNLKKVQEEDIP
jgi:hypothetical protein